MPESAMTSIAPYIPGWDICPVVWLWLLSAPVPAFPRSAAQAWLQKHPNVTFHFTPTHSSWVNLVECFFSILTRQGLQQNAFHSVRELERFLKQFVYEYNFRCGPFEWTAGPKKFEKIIRLTREYQTG